MSQSIDSFAADWSVSAIRLPVPDFREKSCDQVFIVEFFVYA